MHTHILYGKISAAARFTLAANICEERRDGLGVSESDSIAIA